MSVVSLGWQSPRPKDRTGNTVAEGSDIPVFKGANLTSKQIVSKLETALEYLSESHCSFWACRGPKRPGNMITCVKCRAMREIGMALAAIRRQS